MKYSVNLVRRRRLEEQKSELLKSRMVTLSVLCFGILGLAVFYGALQTLSMVAALNSEKQKLARIETEYRKYKATRMIVDKADIELLDTLQSKRIFWTRKLASMALHLPDNYWITAFRFGHPTYNVKGYGYISPDQEQLVTLDDYLNLLREDSTWNDNFRTTYLNSTVREDEGARQRVSFEYSSISSAIGYGTGRVR